MGLRNEKNKKVRINLTVMGVILTGFSVGSMSAGAFKKAALILFFGGVLLMVIGFLVSKKG